MGMIVLVIGAGMILFVVLVAVVIVIVTVVVVVMPVMFMVGVLILFGLLCRLAGRLGATERNPHQAAGHCQQVTPLLPFEIHFLLPSN
jgi:hypothetical protein